MSATVDPRFVVRRRLELNCQVVRERGFRLVGLRTLDVSTEGIRVEWTGDPLLTGETVIATLQLPDMWIDVEGTVARVCHARRKWDAPSFGVSFDVIEPSARAALAGFLLGLPEAGGQRRKLSSRRERVEVLAHQIAVKEILAGWSSLSSVGLAVG